MGSVMICESERLSVRILSLCFKKESIEKLTLKSPNRIRFWIVPRLEENRSISTSRSEDNERGR